MRQRSRSSFVLGLFSAILAGVFLTIIILPFAEGFWTTLNNTNVPAQANPVLFLGQAIKMLWETSKVAFSSLVDYWKTEGWLVPGIFLFFYTAGFLALRK